jgi:hypothetical protein
MCGKEVAIVQSLWTKLTLCIVVWCIVVSCSKLIQNAFGGHCPDLVLSPKFFPCLCAKYKCVNWCGALGVQSGHYTCPPSYSHTVTSQHGTLSHCINKRPSFLQTPHNSPQENSPNMALRYPVPHSHIHSSPRDTLVQHVTRPATPLAQSLLCDP